MDDRPNRTPSDALLTRAEQAPGLSPEEREQLTGSIRRLQASRGLIIRGADLIAGLFGGAAAAASRGLQVSPALAGKVEALYGLRISEKFAIQAVPLVGAAGGALINSMFFDHYRCPAQAHFTLRRLERDHRLQLVRREAMPSSFDGTPPDPISRTTGYRGSL